METNGWLVRKLHGNAYQAGLPDWIAFHPVHGIRLIETKTPTGQLTKAQRIEFPELLRYKAPLYVLRDHHDYELLFKEPNAGGYILNKGSAFTGPI